MLCSSASCVMDVIKSGGERPRILVWQEGMGPEKGARLPGAPLIKRGRLSGAVKQRESGPSYCSHSSLISHRSSAIRDRECGWVQVKDSVAFALHQLSNEIGSCQV